MAGLVKDIRSQMEKITGGKLFWPLLSLVFVVCRLGTWLYPFDSDHWIFYYVGSDWFHGGKLYLTAWDHKPPVIFAINGLMSLVFGDNIVLHRIFFTAVAIFGIYLFYILLQQIVPALKAKNPELITRIGLLFYVFWVSLSQFTSSGNNTENFGVVFLLGMLLLYLEYRKKGNLWRLFGAGTCLSFMFFLKPNFLLLAVPVGLYIIFDNLKTFWKIIRDGFIFGLPLLIQTGLWVWYFAAQGRVGDLLVATLQFSAKYSSSAWVGQLSQLKTFYELVAIASPLIIFVPIGFLLLAPRYWRQFEYGFFALEVLLGSFALFAVGVPYLYYFMIMLPIYIIASIYFFFTDGFSLKLKWIFGSILVLGMALNLGFSYYEIVQAYRGNTHEEAVEYSEIAKYVDDHTSSSDKVFDYDYGATFYELSHRESGSRYISSSVLLLDYRGNYGFHLDDTFISDMEKSKAKYVVVYRDKDNLYYQNKPIVEYFDSHYHLEKTFDKFEVLRRN